MQPLPTFKGLPKLPTFLTEFKELVTELQRLSALEFALKATPVRWWGTHKISIIEWPQCRWLLEVRFGDEATTVTQRYTGLSDPVENMEQCSPTFSNYPRQEWVHYFIHTLEMAPRGWYTSMELH